MIKPKEVLRAQASYTKKFFKCLWFLSHYNAAAKHAQVTSLDVPYYWLTKEEKTRAQFIAGSAQYKGTIKK